MKKYTLVLILLVFSTPCFAENNLSFEWGYHWWESGYTFPRSGVRDRKFDGVCWQVQYTRWFDNIGISLSGGKNLNVHESLGRTTFKAQLKTLELLPQYRFDLSENIDLRLFGGLNYSRLKTSVHNVREVLRGFW